MKKIDLGQAISILANVGVIAGIVFLAVEIRQNNDLLISQAGFAQLTAEIERRSRWIDNTNEFLDIALKKSAGEPLTPAENVRLRLHGQNVLDTFRWQYRELEAGRLPDGYIDLAAWRRVWRNTPSLREVFEDDRSELDPGFVQFIEAQIVRNE
jgi:hypothetical protein